jgi:hypothetical protein
MGYRNREITEYDLVGTRAHILKRAEVHRQGQHVEQSTS